MAFFNPPAHDSIRLEMWEEERRKYSVGVAAICGQCRGASMSSCRCAQIKFMDRLTTKAIADYKERRRQTLAAQLATVDDERALARAKLENDYDARKTQLQDSILKYTTS